MVGENQPYNQFERRQFGINQMCHALAYDTVPILAFVNELDQKPYFLHRWYRPRLGFKGCAT